MFDNIGEKIKKVAKIVCWFGIILCIIIGIAIIIPATDSHDSSLATTSLIISLAIMVGGAFASWVSSIILYGFGQLIEDNHQMRIQLESNPAPVNQKSEPSIKTNSVAKPKNFWTCAKCGKVNPCSADTCSNCGFSSHAYKA